MLVLSGNISQSWSTHFVQGTQLPFVGSIKCEDPI